MISIGFDIGGTNTKIVVLNDRYQTLKNLKIKTPLNGGYNFFITELKEIVKSIKREFKNEGKTSVCLGIAGDVDFENGILRYAPNLNGWRNKNIKRDFENATKIKCNVENDANMASWGVYVFDIKRKVKNLVVFTLGTGVGGGIILNGRLYRGYTSTAGEIGHMIIKEGGEKCNCGNYGCLEAYCGTYAIIREINKKDKFFCKKQEITPKLLFQEALNGNKNAISVWDCYGYHLGTGIGNMAVVLNPDIIAITGGVSGAAKFFMPGVKRRLSEYGIETPINKMKIKISTNQDIGVLGCASFGLEKK